MNKFNFFLEIKIKMFKIVRLRSSELASAHLTHAQYLIGPFLRGQSVTLASALRRTLLSELEGSAIVGLNIPGINTEYTTIPNIKEDVIELSLNLRQIFFVTKIQEPFIAHIKINGRNKRSSIITAKDLILPKHVTISNPQAYIASLIKLDSETELNIELLIATGRSYVSSSDIRSEIPERFIPIDAKFTPVAKVASTYEPSRDNLTEMLILDIWTRTPVEPDLALIQASKSLCFAFQNFYLNRVEESPGEGENFPKRVNPSDLENRQGSTSLRQKSTSLRAPAAIIARKKVESYTPIAALMLQSRTYNALVRAKILTVENAKQLSEKEISAIPGIGKTSRKDLSQALQKYTLDKG